ATFLVRTGECQRTLGEGVRLFQAASQRLRLPQGETQGRLTSYPPYCADLVPCLREQRHGVGDAPGQGIRRSQGRGGPGGVRLDVPCPAQSKAPFEHGDGLVAVAFVEEQHADTEIRTDAAEWVLDRLGYAHPFLGAGDALTKRSQL